MQDRRAPLTWGRRPFEVIGTVTSAALNSLAWALMKTSVTPPPIDRRGAGITAPTIDARPWSANVRPSMGDRT